MKTSFFPRFFAFALAFWVGAVGCVLLVTIIQSAADNPLYFWKWLPRWMRYNVLPIALDETIRSPLLGILFAWLGTRRFRQRDNILFGLGCGMLSYGLGYLFLVTLSRAGLSDHAGWTSYIILGVPLVLILLSHLLPRSKTVSAGAR